MVIFRTVLLFPSHKGKRVFEKREPFEDISVHPSQEEKDLYIVSCNTSLCKDNFINTELRMFNHLPYYTKETPALYRFKNDLKNFLFDHCFYSVDKYFIFLGKSSSQCKLYSPRIN
jgi:hypothetical protein